MTDVSVVMGTFNGARHIEEQLRTVIDQTEPPVEILIGDDGSEDGTVDIIARVAASSLVPISIHVNEYRLGFADNFLAQAARAESRFVAFCDQDDRWAPDKLARARRALLAEDALLCVHPVALITDAGRRMSVDDQQAASGVIEARSAFQWRNFFGFTMLFERALLDVAPWTRRGRDIHTPGAPLPHDRWISFLALNLGRTVVLPDVLAEYRQHDRQLYGSGTGTASPLERRIDWIQRATARIGTSAARLDFLGSVAQDLADLLDEAEATSMGDTRLAAARWHHIAAAYRRRAEVHTERSPFRSAHEVLAGLRKGDYAGPDVAGLGRKALAEDLTLGLFGGRTGAGARP